MDERAYDDAAVDFSSAYAEELVQLASVRVDHPGIEHLLDQLLIVTQRAMVASIAISVTAIEEDGSFATAAATSAAAREVDAFEYVIDEGPCIEALATGAEQVLDDVASDRRWPRFSRHAAEAGFASVVGIPLRIDESTIGALNLYANDPSGLDDDREAARRLAGPAAIVLANGSAYRRTHLLNAEFEARIRDLAVVNQAVGVLMAHRHCGTRQAKELLLATADATGRTLEEVASHIVGDADA